jgi:predicted transcriptional regulator
VERLSKLGKVLKVSPTLLAGEAIKEYLARRARKAEADLGSTLEDLRAYRKSDPDFEQSIAKFIQAELSVKDDPAEGTVFMEEGTDLDPVGPARKALRKVLND